MFGFRLFSFLYPILRCFNFGDYFGNPDRSSVKPYRTTNYNKKILLFELVGCRLFLFTS